MRKFEENLRHGYKVWKNSNTKELQCFIGCSENMLGALENTGNFNPEN